MKHPARSKTLLFHIIFGSVESLVTSIQILQPFMAPLTFAVASLILTQVHVAGGIYLRSITTEGLSMKAAQ